MSQRIAYFDNSKAILILLVVGGHLLTPFIDDSRFLYSFYHVIFIFHMPAFIFLTGYFTRKASGTKYYWKIFTTFLLPYILFQVVYAVYYTNLYEKPFQIEFLTPRWAMWFLLCIAAYKLLSPFILKSKTSVLLSVSIVAGLLVGYFDIERFLSLDRLFVFLPFFVLGVVMGRSEKPIRLPYMKWVAPVVLGGLFLLFYLYKIEGLTDLLYGTYVYESNMGLLVRLGYYVGTVFVMFMFFSIIPKTPIVITPIGSRTFAIYLFHGFIIKWFLEQQSAEVISTLWGIPFIVIFTLTIAMILSLPFFSKLLAFDRWLPSPDKLTFNKR
ncbi:acyltransferase family protein [Alkalihalobacillus sp. R86527]|uniref:acyltransferase family protein n=1 Tax=Alkalihalobacillus sp. R86527 TaxID=3093863 RepID=UPI003671FBDB